MKQSNILLTGAAALVALTAVAGISFMTYAQSDGTATSNTPWMGMHKWQNLTEEQKAELEATREERQATAEANRQKIQDAFAEGYDAWVKTVKEVTGEDAPILSQVTAENFSRFAEAHGYMEKAQGIFSELGIERGFGFGGQGAKMGQGGCLGAKGGFMRGQLAQ